MFKNMNCPVCLGVIEANTQRCPQCNYSPANKVFKDTLEETQWMQKVIIPCRNKYLEQLEAKLKQLELSTSETDALLRSEIQEYLTFIKEETLIENITKIEFTEDFGYPRCRNEHIYTLKFDNEELVATYTHKYSQSSTVIEEYGIYETAGILSKNFLRKIICEEKIYQLNTQEDETEWHDAPSWRLKTSLKYITTVAFTIDAFGWLDSKMLPKLFNTSLGIFFTKKPSEIKIKNNDWKITNEGEHK